MNTFGHKFKVTVWGASHAPSVGVRIDGVPERPAGTDIPLAFAPGDFAQDIDRRRPKGLAGTPRREEDVPVLSVPKDGTLICEFPNRDVRSEDYNIFEDIPRPSHADRVARLRFGEGEDIRGGGRFSGRLTLGLVAAGVVAKKILEGRCSFCAKVVEVGGERDSAKWEALLGKAAAEGDSLGGIVECSASVPAGLGNPFWDSVESLVSHAVFSIPGVRGIEFGDGFAASSMRGSEHNDPFGKDGLPEKNGAGGVNGGITNGAALKFRVAFKPTSTIAAAQKTLNFKTGEMTVLRCPGRHDVCFALRTPVIVEAVTAIVFADLILSGE